MLIWLYILLNAFELLCRDPISAKVLLQQSQTLRHLFSISLQKKLADSSFGSPEPML